MAGRRILWLLALMGCGLLYLFYQQWVSCILLAVVLGLPALSLLCSLPAMLSVQVSVGCPAVVPMGEAAQARLRYACRLPLPPVRGKLRVTNVLTGEQARLTGTGSLPTEHCGGLICQGEKVYVYDYLKLFRRRVRSIPPGRAQVNPRPAPVPAADALSRPPRGYQAKPGGGFSENHELRLYRPGDNLRLLHWKLTAKTGKLIYREPVEPMAERILVSLTLSGSPEELDRMLGRLLTLGRNLLAQEYSFELHAVTGDGLHIFSISDEEALRRCLSELLFLPAARDAPADETAGRFFRHYTIGGDPDEA